MQWGTAEGSFTHPFNKQRLITFYVQGSILSPKDIAVIKTAKVPDFTDLTFQSGKDRQ